MRHLLLAIAALGCAFASGPAGAAADPPRLTLEQRMLVRCSAAFAIVAERQAKGDPAALLYPPLAQRGREYFVRSAASVMDSAQLDRPAIDAALKAEARDLVAGGTLPQLMPVCLQALEDSGL